MSESPNTGDFSAKIAGLGASLGNLIMDGFDRFESSQIGRKIMDPVNGFLKSADEIETEFSEAMNSYRGAFKEMQSAAFIELRNNRDGYLNITYPRVDSGYQEENY